ncbi:hypothetical protein [Marivita hallyeonensis]|uniref:Uncharacterized protein n=1 Tax=Marivita hallyeonensis TaxID=996342 RepID=A0A1M5XY39_9RHOB|nr:hypothetical protein [Marivita hallyeonensis]SHI04504.1 hypothetical protein SAMN05443551_4189 [Marivita hallyeonensis]
MPELLSQAVHGPVFYGALASILSVFAYLPYIANILRGRTRPHRACWLIWSVLSIISFLSQLYEGAGASLGFAAAQAGSTTIVFLLSVIRGSGTFMGRADGVVLAVAAIGVGLWAITDSAAYALMISITISLMGGMLTVQKTYWFPDSETMSTWVLSFIASCCALLAVGPLDWLLLAYPMYLFVLNGAIIGAWMLGRLPGARERQADMSIFRSVRAR